MEYLSLYGLFLAKVLTVVLSIVILAVVCIGLGVRKTMHKGELRLTNLGESYKEKQRQMQQARMSEAEQKVWQKAFKKQQKIDEKQKKAAAKTGQKGLQKPNLYVLDFKGSMDAHEVDSLREEISAILAVADKKDEVLLRLESPGGMVHGYGLAASQLTRLRQKGIRLTVVVDKVAASGGYMMACVADRIIAAPFAIIGSIGVVAQLPNIHRLLKKNDIDVELHTAGEYKRTLTMFGENTEQGRKKFQEDLNETHKLFKSFIYQHRPSLDVESVATGEYWYGTQAKEHGLIDEVGVSDDFLIEQIDHCEVIGVSYSRRKRVVERVMGGAMENIDKLFMRWWQRGQKPLL
ncbi:protease SohB [Xenorhabdus nematophila]|uniref:Peptidase n=1 Tax=Xenorhabdus nematophila (strain ATCC 19061 / DSM 3370 / CCUG 14189 / LMG 1036 / NCIMB 9965 / AN6) TaxID=406817 RepID=D3VGP7_XENNA|nr:protease SohB [Xenorhabdus nematophila]CEE92098.1 putative peptidase [Xenorhabdus nematophila str. Anatoliense]CEF32881.1 putative peptidase [Xenorhabdus nematophila str. Websteri]AYA40149.1 protease SohB [Xenorhabdus nematophila]MBA0018798.1 protease SohB [Xenorhabdus nematophila]MCB4425348.1 protease SohB [Xenorhabdus nematophila]